MWRITLFLVAFIVGYGGNYVQRKSPTPLHEVQCETVSRRTTGDCSQQRVPSTLLPYLRQGEKERGTILRKV